MGRATSCVCPRQCFVSRSPDFRAPTAKYLVLKSAVRCSRVSHRHGNTPRLRSAVCALLGVAFVAACGDSGPQVPTTLESGATITTLAAAAATQATVVPSVTLRDARGNGIAGIWVHFAVTGGGKLVNDSAATTKTGNASAGTWTLGPIAGVQTVIATAAGLPPITFVAQVAAGPAARVVRVAPDSQRTTVNTATALPPSVQVVDQYDNPVQGVAVTFVAAGGAMTGAQKPPARMAWRPLILGLLARRQARSSGTRMLQGWRRQHSALLRWQRNRRGSLRCPAARQAALPMHRCRRSRSYRRCA
jgi:hypothetical protein